MVSGAAEETVDVEAADVGAGPVVVGLVEVGDVAVADVSSAGARVVSPVVAIVGVGAGGAGLQEVKSSAVTSAHPTIRVNCSDSGPGRMP